MSAVAEAPLPIQMTDAAANKVKTLITEEENPELKLRVYITGGGCSGFQYGFTFDEKINEGDTVVEKSGVTMVIDPMSLQYLVGGSVDYTEGLEGSRFTVTNPNATTTCGCGSSSLSDIEIPRDIEGPQGALFVLAPHPYLLVSRTLWTSQ